MKKKKKIIPFFKLLPNERMVKCPECDGKGYIKIWTFEKPQIEIIDCLVCKGKGEIKYQIIDSRKVSKNKKLEVIE